MDLIIYQNEEKMLQYLTKIVNTAKKIHPDVWEMLKKNIDGVASEGRKRELCVKHNCIRDFCPKCLELAGDDVIIYKNYKAE